MRSAAPAPASHVERKCFNIDLLSLAPGIECGVRQNAGRDDPAASIEGLPFEGEPYLGPVPA